MAQYALVDATHTDFLLPGKNVIGRGSVELEGVSFVEIYSPNSSVSRVQANIEICPNGDAWICDCNSTNGTFLSVNDGPGVCLAQKHYYQLTHGCRVVFGDVERVFKRITPASENRAVSCSPSSARGSRSGKEAAGGAEGSTTETSRQSRAVVRESTKTVEPLSPQGDSGVPRRLSGSASKNRKGSAHHIPYLADEEVEEDHSEEKRSSKTREPSTKSSAAVNARTTTATTASRNDNNNNNNNNNKRKTSRGSVAEGGDETTAAATLSPAKRARVEKESNPAAATAAGSKSIAKDGSTELLLCPVIACLSGMDADEREEAKKLIRPFGRVVDDITKANVLVVRLPAVRTPKFIIAVGRGIPIVAIETFKNHSPPMMRNTLMNTIVSLKHEKVDYVASLLRQSIDTHINSPCLTGKSFSIQALPHKNRDVAKDIIQGCGGKIVRGKATAGAEELTEDSLQALYDSILRAKA